MNLDLRNKGAAQAPEMKTDDAWEQATLPVMKKDVLVIGAGISGLAAAQELARAGMNVGVVEKARGSGGRLSSKRLSGAERDYGFDLGCSAVEWSHETFEQQIDSWREEGVVTDYPGHEGVVIGQSRNSGITRAMLGNIEASFATRITRLERDGENWKAYVESDGGERLFSESRHIILSCPPQQTFDLLPDQHNLKAEIGKIEMLPQWVALLVVKSEPALEPNCPEQGNALHSISLESRKRALSLPENLHLLQVQGGVDWTKQRVDLDPQKVLQELIRETEISLGLDIEVVEKHIHRWLYSRVDRSAHAPQAGFFMSDDGIGICGDYLGAGLSEHDLEAAWLSGRALAQAML